MKSIVVYTFAIVWIFALDCTAQKPAIDLLPSSRGQVHPEELIDTIHTYDSLQDLPSGGLDSIYSIREDAKISFSNSEEPEKEVPMRIRLRQGTHPLLFIKLNPIHFFLHITALKI